MPGEASLLRAVVEEVLDRSLFLLTLPRDRFCR